MKLTPVRECKDCCAMLTQTMIDKLAVCRVCSCDELLEIPEWRMRGIIDDIHELTKEGLLAAAESARNFSQHSSDCEAEWLADDGYGCPACAAATGKAGFYEGAFGDQVWVDLANSCLTALDWFFPNYTSEIDCGRGKVVALVFEELASEL